MHDRKTILFDLDGTLVDSSRDLAAALNHVLNHAGLSELSRSLVMTMVGDGAPDLLRRGFAHHGAEPPADALERYRQHYSANLVEHTRPYEGIPELLTRLQAEGRAMVVVTNKPTAYAEKVVEGLGLAPFFGAVLGPEGARQRKPSPDHVLAGLAAIGREPEDAVMIGDAPTDVAAGREAGTATVAVTWGYRSHQQLVASEPDRVVRTVEELAEVLGVDS